MLYAIFVAMLFCSESCPHFLCDITINEPLFVLQINQTHMFG